MGEPSMMSLQGKVAIVTGASGGIGRACVEALLDAGARVVMADVDESGRELVLQRGEDICRFIPTDVSDESSVQKLIRETVAAFGALDILVNNAARLMPACPVHETTVAEFEGVMAVNVRGTFLCSKYAYPELKRRYGCIINISSMAGIHGEKNHAAYAATKGAINALTQAMAVDYGPDGIRCIAVCPSTVSTPNSDRVIRASPDATRIVELRKSLNPLGYVATPAQVAAVVAFLASSAAAYINGALVPVSGGAECGYGVKY